MAARKPKGAASRATGLARATASERASPLPPQRSCGTMSNHMRLLEMYPSFRDRLFKLETATQKYRSTGLKIGSVPVATIKVVVHVVYNDPSQNISDAQVKSQISALNKDFRAKNTDKSRTPAAFKGLVCDSRVQFTLDHVTRTQTTKPSFADDNGVKKAATGGVAADDTTRFLNIWVCALGGGLLGYAQFPGGPAATDGVVIHSRAFGTSGTVAAPYNKGRSATHEIGHYFNLRHIWGDTPDCSGSALAAMFNPVVVFGMSAISDASPLIKTAASRRASSRIPLSRSIGQVAGRARSVLQAESAATLRAGNGPMLALFR